MQFSTAQWYKDTRPRRDKQQKAATQASTGHFALEGSYVHSAPDRLTPEKQQPSQPLCPHAG